MGDKKTCIQQWIENRASATDDDDDDDSSLLPFLLGISETLQDIRTMVKK